MPSKGWLKEHFTDYYVKQARKDGYPSRAAYKLLELQKKEGLIKPGMVVVDLGAAPGGWSLVVKKLVGPKGSVVALDILPMEPIDGVECIQADFTEPQALERLHEVLADQAVDLVISDMAPNISGIKSADQARSIYLVELALDFAQQVLKPKGTFLAKVFQGSGVDEFLRDCRGHFSKVKLKKPPASRARSSEVYVLAQGLLKKEGT